MRRQGPGQDFALIVTPRPTAPPMQWDRDHQVSTQCLECRPGVFRPQSAKEFRDCLSGGLFHAQYQFAEQAVIRTKPDRPVKPDAIVAARGAAVGQGNERADIGGASGTGGIWGRWSEPSGKRGKNSPGRRSTTGRMRHRHRGRGGGADPAPVHASITFEHQ
jgi:hypothetical protein